MAPVERIPQPATPLCLRLTTLLSLVPPAPPPPRPARFHTRTQAVLEQHKARRKADSTTLMTMVFKKAAINHRTRALDDDLVIAVNADTNQVLRYVRRCTCTARTACCVAHACWLRAAHTWGPHDRSCTG